MSSAVILLLRNDEEVGDYEEGVSRVDGAPSDVVHIYSKGSGTTHELELWDVCNPLVPDDDDAKVPELEKVTAKHWKFTAAGYAAQSFGFELIVDRGLSTEVRSRRKFAIPTENGSFVLPLFGEGADREASLQNKGTIQVANSVDNVDGNWRGYQPRLIEIIMALDDLIT